MNDNELLQAISEMMDKKLEPIQQDITKIKVFLENDIDKKLSALFEGHQLNTEKLNDIGETVDDIDAAMIAVDIVTKANIKEINKLKTKIG
ncbi:hypothetical protein [Caproiciproducens sp.]